MVSEYRHIVNGVNENMADWLRAACSKCPVTFQHSCDGDQEITNMVPKIPVILFFISSLTFAVILSFIPSFTFLFGAKRYLGSDASHSVQTVFDGDFTPTAYNVDAGQHTSLLRVKSKKKPNKGTCFYDIM